ncbi:MAG TPA: hypothetical protein VIH06_14505, partial [Ilumatobacteraceae bacterium]
HRDYPGTTALPLRLTGSITFQTSTRPSVTTARHSARPHGGGNLHSDTPAITAGAGALMRSVRPSA